MKVSTNFTAEEFLSPKLIAKIRAKRQDPRRYINYNLVNAAEFVRSFFNTYFTVHFDNVAGVSMNGNKSGVDTRGFRSWVDKTSGAELSDHKFFLAFDSDIVLIMKDGTRQEVNYKDLIQIIFKHEKQFLEAGITMIEDPSIAKTWLHFSIAWTGSNNLILVK
jgi:hypothetical protein